MLPGDHIFKKSSRFREILLCLGALSVSASLLAGSSTASGSSTIKPSTSPGPEPGSLVTETYEFTGEPESFTVPEGIEAINVDALGAAGGYGGISVEPIRNTVTRAAASPALSTPSGSFAPGGAGGEVQASIPVSAGQTLTVTVGGTGANSETSSRHSGAPTISSHVGGPPSLVVAAPGAPGAHGGYNGGGDGGGSEYFYFSGSTFLFFGGGGGGASTLSLSSTPLIVAGGGGGGGANRGEHTHPQAGVKRADTLEQSQTAGGLVTVVPSSNTPLPSTGGSGGGSNAQEGSGESGTDGSAPGGAGGGESTPGSVRELGGAGEGDNSGDDPDEDGGFTGGGGGGGYYGGLGGSFGICVEACEEAGAGGGGGGSDYAEPSASGAILTRGANTAGAAGQITLSYFDPYPTTTEATPTPSKAATGETVTLTGTVDAGGPCEGTIEFQLDGTATGPPIPINSNTAQTTITAPPTGTHQIIAIYSGAPSSATAAGCLPSSSAPTTLTTTTPYPTTTTATPTPSRATTGETVTLTGTVDAGGPCEGTIEFQLDGTATGPPIPINSNTAQTTITAPAPGVHQIVAIYSSAPTTATSPGCLPSRSEPTTLTTTSPYPTTTTATPTPSKATTGETVTLTGTVKAGGPCEGTIEFQLDGTATGPPIPINSNTAQTTITAPPAGTHQIIAIYSGAPTTATSPGCLPSRSEPTTLTTAAPLISAEALVPIKKSLICQSTRHFAIHLQLPRRLKLLGATVYIDGKRVKRLGENSRIYKLNLRGRPYATITITLSAREPSGRTIKGKRIYHTCRGHRLPAHTTFKI
jgi:Bacterial Ig-like domain (group 3)/Glycine rich protein